MTKQLKFISFLLVVFFIQVLNLIIPLKAHSAILLPSVSEYGSMISHVNNVFTTTATEFTSPLIIDGNIDTGIIINGIDDGSTEYGSFVRFVFEVGSNVDSITLNMSISSNVRTYGGNIAFQAWNYSTNNYVEFHSIYSDIADGIDSYSLTFSPVGNDGNSGHTDVNLYDILNPSGNVSFAAYGPFVNSIQQPGLPELFLNEVNVSADLCNNLIDSDGDGISDCDDLCPNDPDKTKPGTCGCSIADTDSDEDGEADCLGTDDDNDGLSDGEERGPNGNVLNYDGNGDGIADCLQGNVASFHTFDQKNYVTLESPVGTSISNCNAVSNPSSTNAPSNVKFSYGFFKFIIDGLGIASATTVTLHLPFGETIDTYYKFGSTPNNTTNHWYEFLNDGQTGAEINGNVITLHFIDGH